MLLLLILTAWNRVLVDIRGSSELHSLPVRLLWICRVGSLSIHCSFSFTWHPTACTVPLNTWPLILVGNLDTDEFYYPWQWIKVLAGNQWVQFICITRSLSNSPMSGHWKVWKWVASPFLSSLFVGTNPHLGFHCLKCLKTASSDPSNKWQNDDENPTPHSSDSFPGTLKLRTEIGCLYWALAHQAALTPAAKFQRAGLLGERCWSPANSPPGSSSCPWYKIEQSLAG